MNKSHTDSAKLVSELREVITDAWAGYWSACTDAGNAGTNGAALDYMADQLADHIAANLIERDASDAGEAQTLEFLEGGTRYKLSPTKRGGAEFCCFPGHLAGQWVALVDATDNRHMRLVDPTAPASKWCEHVGGLGPPFPYCKICQGTAPASDGTDHVCEYDGIASCTICSEQAASDGGEFVSVPREPSNAMMQAGYKAYGGTMYSPLHEQGWGNSAIAIYKAMLAAALAERPLDEARTASATKGGVAKED